MITIATMIVRQPWALETSSCASESEGRWVRAREERVREEPESELFSE